MSTFKHNNIDITLATNGEFMAKINGIEVSAVSLPAMKKKIDKTAPFTAFKAFTIDYNDRISEHTIIGIQKRRGYRGYEWRTEQGRTYGSVYLDTPKARAAVKKLLAAKAAHEKSREAQDRLETKLTEAIGVEISPNEPV